MSYIVSEVYDAFRELGLSEEKAKAAAAAIPGQQRVASKADIADLKADIARDFQPFFPSTIRAYPLAHYARRCAETAHP